MRRPPDPQLIEFGFSEKIKDMFCYIATNARHIKFASQGDLERAFVGPIYPRVNRTTGWTRSRSLRSNAPERSVRGRQTWTRSDADRSPVSFDRWPL